MFWADEIVKTRKGKEVLEDAWTPSGIVHMGGLKGPVIHDVLYKVLKEQKKEAKYIYGFDDFDPIDGLPPSLEATYKEYMGVLTFMVIKCVRCSKRLVLKRIFILPLIIIKKVSITKVYG